MNARKAKFLIILVMVIFVFFFSNDFGLIDVEKTSIITAVAVDKGNDGFNVTAQIAVPEATDTNSENLKAQICGKGATVGEALKDLGDLSGWFPKLAFCNLILLGDSLSETNVITVLDYFAKTLRVQDSALVALADGKASELLGKATPLDNISAFALQKIMLKNIGFDRDISSVDVKTFCAGHYSSSKSAFMPIVKIVSTEAGGSSDKSSEASSNSGSNESSSSSAGSSTKTNQNYLFDARTTALFLNGKKVGELDEDLTLVFNALTSEFNGTTIPVKDVPFNGENTNYLLSVQNSHPKISVCADNANLTLKIKLNLYCKVVDHSADGSEEALSQNLPLPPAVKEKAEAFFTDKINELIMTEQQTGCDILKVKEKLYRFNYKQYSRYKDNYLSVLKTDVKVSITGQK